MIFYIFAVVMQANLETFFNVGGGGLKMRDNLTPPHNKKAGKDIDY